LRYADIKKDSNGDYFVLAHPHITKTAIYEKYPLPSEVVVLLPDDILDSKLADKKIFNFHKNTIYLHYNKLIANSDMQFNNNFGITTHDHRNIFVSILVKNGFDSELADACLSHSNSKIKNLYLEVGYEKRSEIFKEYWKILKSETR
jgi:hypothetical protein